MSEWREIAIREDYISDVQGATVSLTSAERHQRTVGHRWEADVGQSPNREIDPHQ